MQTYRGLVWVCVETEVAVSSIHLPLQALWLMQLRLKLPEVRGIYQTPIGAA